MKNIFKIQLFIYVLSLYACMNRHQSNSCRRNHIVRNIDIEGGIVREKIRDSWNHQNEEVHTNRSIFSWEDDAFDGYFDQIAIGDSIIKKEGSLILEVYKADTVLFLDISYPCGEDEIIKYYERE